MKEALAHQTFYPHVHPHAPVSAFADGALTLIFFGALFGLGKLGTAILRKFAARNKERL